MKRKIFKDKILPLRDKLFRISFRITCNKEEAEDVVQDIMLKIWQMRDEWDKIESMDAYCCMMSKNMSIRRITLRENQRTDIRDIPENLKEEKSPLMILEETEIKELIETMITGLPEKERLVLQLRNKEEMDYKSIAETLHITESQVKINLFRGRQKLKELFNRIK